MSDQPVVVESLLNAPVEIIWKALTDNTQMKQWYFDIAEFEPVIGFEFEFAGKGTEGESYLHKCKVIEVSPQQKLKHSWRYEGYDGLSYVTWELTEQGSQANVKITHEGLDTFPQQPQFAKANFEGGWNYLVNTALKNFVEKH